jgi:hypothetical protein
MDIKEMIPMAKKADEKKKTPAPQLIVLSSEAEQKKAAGEVPVLDIVKVLKDHEKTYTLVFQPQGYRVKLAKPPMADVEALLHRRDPTLKKYQSQASRMEELVGKKEAGKVLTDEELEFMEKFTVATLPFSLDATLLCMREPEDMTMEQLKEWIATLAGNQVKLLFMRAAELISPVSLEEVESLKN